MRVPTFAPPKIVEPIRLREAVRRLGQPSARAREVIGAAHKEAAMALLRRQLATTTMLGAPVKLVPSLVDLLAQASESRARRAIVSLLVHAESISWRRLWVVWQLADEEGQAVIPLLARRIHQRTIESARFRQNLPGWL